MSGGRRERGGGFFLVPACTSARAYLSSCCRPLPTSHCEPACRFHCLCKMPLDCGHPSSSRHQRERQEWGSGVPRLLEARDRWVRPGSDVMFQHSCWLPVGERPSAKLPASRRSDATLTASHKTIVQSRRAPEQAQNGCHDEADAWVQGPGALRAGPPRDSGQGAWSGMEARDLPVPLFKPDLTCGLGLMTRRASPRPGSARPSSCLPCPSPS